jgi:recombination protein RecT
MSNALQPKNQTAIQAIGSFSAEDVQIMHQMFGADLTPEQFRFFVRASDAMGLNPFYGHVTPVVYKGKLSIQIQAEGYVYKGRQVEGYQGHDVQLVHENDTFKARKVIDIGPDGKQRDTWQIVEHEVGFPRGRIIGGYAIAYREGFRPFVVLMDVEEVEHMKKGFNAHMWNSGFFPDMFKKHMLKRAYKGQFGIDLNDQDFQPVGGDIPAYEPQRRDITEEANAAAAEQKQQEPPQQAQPEDGDAKYEELRKQMNAKFKELGITGKDAKAAYIAEKGVVKGETPTVAELTKLLKLMDLDIAKKAAQATDDDDLLAGFEP